MTHYETRVEGTKKAIEKITKKIERINKALATGKNPYLYDERDLSSSQRELTELLVKLRVYEEKVALEQSIENIPVIEEFLEEWKKKAIVWYKQDYKMLLNYMIERRKKQDEFTKWKIEKFGSEYARNEQIKPKEKELGIDYESYKQDLDRKFNSMTIKLMEYRNDWEEQLEKWTEQEKIAKRKTLIERVKGITGEITDATGLYIGDNAEINGIVVGKKGKAQVETISAGGYNIQCYHYRVLVRKLDN